MMPRTAKLGKKRGYWFTKAGAPNGIYFGRVDQVAQRDALKAFRAHLASLDVQPPKPVARGPMTVGELVELFLTWRATKGSERNYEGRRLHLSRFSAFAYEGRQLAAMPAIDVRAVHLQAFLDFLRGLPKGYDPWTIAHHDTSVRACFRWATRQPSAPDRTYLPVGHMPFASVERYRRPVDADLASHEDLPTPDEIEKLLAHADEDLGLLHENGRYFRRPADQRRTGRANPYRGFADVLRVFHATGARTGELAAARVRHFHAALSQIVLTAHKTAGTTKEPKARVIKLSAEAKAIVARLVDGRQPDEPIFLNYAARDAAEGVPWTPGTLVNRFKQVRKNSEVRKSLTIYSFRHLWISDAIMQGVDVSTVAKMAGTSIAMIERVYGHLATDHLADALARVLAKRKPQGSGA